MKRNSANANNRPAAQGATASTSKANTSSTPTNNKLSLSKKLKIPNVEDKLVQFIMDEIVDHGQNVKFSDIGNYLLIISLKLIQSSQFLTI